MPTPSKVPKTLLSVPGEVARAMTAKRISAAGVTSRPVRPSPVTTAAVVEPASTACPAVTTASSFVSPWPLLAPPDRRPPVHLDGGRTGVEPAVAAR